MQSALAQGRRGCNPLRRIFTEVVCSERSLPRSSFQMTKMDQNNGWNRLSLLACRGRGGTSFTRAWGAQVERAAGSERRERGVGSEPRGSLTQRRRGVAGDDVAMAGQDVR